MVRLPFAGAGPVPCSSTAPGLYVTLNVVFVVFVFTACVFAEIRHLTVDNAGWELLPLVAGEAVSEELQIRGYKLVKHDQVKFTYTAPGHYVIDDRTA